MSEVVFIDLRIVEELYCGSRGVEVDCCVVVDMVIDLSYLIEVGFVIYLGFFVLMIMLYLM